MTAALGIAGFFVGLFLWFAGVADLKRHNRPKLGTILAGCGGVVLAAGLWLVIIGWGHPGLSEKEMLMSFIGAMLILLAGSSVASVIHLVRSLNSGDGILILWHSGEIAASLVFIACVLAMNMSGGAALIAAVSAGTVLVYWAGEYWRWGWQ